jgi:transcriptional regulator with XRE-family HTH domain
MNQSEIDAGAKIRSYRKRKGLSLTKLSEMTGIAASNLSSLELNKTSPTLQTLARIADAFDVKISEFLDEIFYRKVLICDPDELRPLAKKRKQVMEYHLTSGVTLNRLEAKMMEFLPNAGPTSVPGANTDRFAFVLCGSLLLTTTEEKTLLNEGQGVYLAPDVEAALQNAGLALANVLIVHTKH